MTKIKICGITRPEEILYLNEEKVDHAGFVIYEKSKRYITVNRAEKIAENLDAGIKKVAVTVSPDVSLLHDIESSGFDIIQIHGELSNEIIENASIPIWYAVNANDTGEAQVITERINNLQESLLSKIEAIVMDAPEFGSGRTFDWQQSRRMEFTAKKFVLAGGLNEKNVAEGIEIFKPDIVDVSSSVEGENGKDKDKIKVFVNAVRAVNK